MYDNGFYKTPGGENTPDTCTACTEAPEGEGCDTHNTICVEGGTTLQCTSALKCGYILLNGGIVSACTGIEGRIKVIIQVEAPKRVVHLSYSLLRF